MNKYCGNCGAELNEGQDVCIKCGKKVNNEEVTAVVKQNTVAVTGFVISMISLFINFFGLVGLAGAITSLVGLLKVNKTKEKGKGLAIVGLIIGIISVIYGIYTTLSVFDILPRLY